MMVVIMLFTASAKLCEDGLLLLWVLPPLLPSSVKPHVGWKTSVVG